jgi:hypothetical protein
MVRVRPSVCDIARVLREWILDMASAWMDSEKLRTCSQAIANAKNLEVQLDARDRAGCNCRILGQEVRSKCRSIMPSIPGK